MSGAMFRKLLMGCGLFVALVGLALGVIYWRATRIPAEALQPALAPSPQAVEEARQQVARVEELLAPKPATPTPVPRSSSQRHTRQAAAPPPPAQRVELSETAINDYLQSEIARLSPSGEVRNPRLKFGQGAVTGSALVRFQDRDWYLTLTARPYVQSDGKLGLELVDARTGRLPLPPQLRQQLQEALDKGLGEQVNTDLRLGGVEVQPGKLIITAPDAGATMQTPYSKAG